MKKLLVRGAKLWTGEACVPCDILVENGIIAAMGEHLQDETAEVYAAEGCVVSPGFTDLHVHLREPGFEAKETVESGTKSALAGGFTTVCSMPNLNPVPDSPAHLAVQQNAIRQHALVRVLPYASVSVGEKGEHLANMEALAAQVPGYSDDGRGVQSEKLMEAAMRLCEKHGRFIAAHCEVEALLPKDGVCIQEGSTLAMEKGFEGVSCESESAEVERNIRLSKKTGCRLHICHTSAARSFELVREAKRCGLPVSCEVAPHHLLLCCEDIEEDDGAYKMNPPLRTEADRQAALKALKDGTADAVATDHAPHTQAEKAGGFAKAACGIVGLELAFALLYTQLVETGHMTPEELLCRFTVGPKAVLGEEQNFLQVGQKADFTLLNLVESRPVRASQFQSKGRSMPFEGLQLKGWPNLTVYGEQYFALPK